MVQTRKRAVVLATEEKELSMVSRTVAKNSDMTNGGQAPASQYAKSHTDKQTRAGKRRQGTKTLQQPAKRIRTQGARKKKQAKKDAYEMDEDDNDDDNAEPPPEFFDKLNKGKAGRGISKRSNVVEVDVEGDGDAQLQLETEMSQRQDGVQAKRQTAVVTQRPARRKQKQIAAEEVDVDDDIDENEDGEEEEVEAAVEEDGDLQTRAYATSDVVNILDIDLSTPDIDFLELEPDSGSEPLTVFVKSNGLHGMIRNMGRRGWMHTPGEWADDLIIHAEETAQEWSRRQKSMLSQPHTWELFSKTIQLWQTCRDLSNAGERTRQVKFLRQHDTLIRTTLDEINHLTGQFQNSMMSLLRATAGRKPDKMPKAWTAMFACTFQKLIPCLVLALKEAFLLGGSPRKDELPEQVNEDVAGQFMACTLQLPIRITWFIQQLYEPFHAYLLRHVPSDDPDAPQMTNNLKISHKNRTMLNSQVANLQSRLMVGMKELKQMADAPRRQKRQLEETRRLRVAREMEQQAIAEANAAQMKRYIASTHAEPYNPQRTRDAYHAQYGWYMWEDERLLNIIRRVKNPSVGQLEYVVPTRTLTELTQRMIDLRQRMRLRYEEAGQVPPKWCY